MFIYVYIFIYNFFNSEEFFYPNMCDLLDIDDFYRAPSCAKLQGN